MALADRIVILDEGNIVQVGPPDETYRQPATPRVADFLGAVNWLTGVVGADSTIETPIGTLRGICHGRRVGARVLTGIRPESVELAVAAGSPYANTFEARVNDVMFLGEYTLYQMHVGGQPLVVRSLAHLTGRDTLWISLPARSIMVFDAESAQELQFHASDRSVSTAHI
jgi:ABC-type Fe3+/spermidine/putrescine transport system ATPase subunit